MVTADKIIKMIDKQRSGEQINEDSMAELTETFEETNYVQFKPLLWTKIAAEYPGILLLDDFLDIQRPDLFSAAYKISLERRAGYQKIHGGQMIVGASNTPEESSLSQMLPAPLANRFIILNITKGTIDEWGKWMRNTYGGSWDKRTLAFLKRYKNEGYHLDVPKETEVLDNFPTPRTWTKTALEMEHVGAGKEVIKGLLGKDIGRKFSSFLEVSVDIDDVIENPSIWEEQTLNAKHMLCLQLSNWFETHMDDPDHNNIEGKAREIVSESMGLMEEMYDDSRQYLILTFISTKRSVLARGILTASMEMNPDLSEIVDQAIDDRATVKEMAK